MGGGLESRCVSVSRACGADVVVRHTATSTPHLVASSWHFKLFHIVTGKGKVYRRTRGIAPLLLNLDPR